MLGYPSRNDFKNMVHAKLIANCPISQNNIVDAHAIFHDNLTGLRGKTVRWKPERVETVYVWISLEFMKMHKFVTLTAVVIFVNNLAFVITFGRGRGLITMEFTPMHMAKQLASNLINVIQLYSRAGLIVQMTLMDMKFD